MHYKKGKQLEKGSFGQVYEGTMTGGVKVAVKVFRTGPEGAKEAAEARHRNVSRVGARLFWLGGC